MYHVSVENFNGCTEAEFELKKITTVFGPNAAGKSSLAYAVGLAASRTTFKTKGEAQENLTAGFGVSQIEISAPDGENFGVCLGLPENKIDSTEGWEDWQISPVAAGLDSLAWHSKEADRFELLHRYLDADPTKEDLAKELKKVGFNAEGVDRIWSKIINPVTKKPDWAKANKTFDGQRKAQKAAFREVSGITWGSDQGAKWLPDGYDREIENESEESLRGALSTLEAERDEALRNEALGDAERDKLATRAGKLDEYIKLHQESSDLIEKLDVRLQEIQGEGEALPRPADECDQFACWSCGELNEIEGDQAVKPKALDKKENDARAAAIKAKRDEYAQVKQERDQAIADLRVIKENIKSGEEAKKTLATLPSGTTTATDVDKARNAVEKARHRLDAFVKITRARELHRDILQSDKLVTVTAPNGLPGQKLGEAITALNAGLKRLCEVAEWGLVKVGKDGAVTYDGKLISARKPSTSEKFRAVVTLQMQFAKIDDAELVVIDAADVLDTDGRQGLYWLLDECEIPALVTCTVSDREECPDLSTYGPAYWIEGGVVSEFVAELQPEPA